MSIKSLTRHTSARRTPQSSPIPGSTQVANSSGGYAWAVDDFARLDRFLILGAEGGSYYASERALTIDNAAAVVRALSVDGARVVARIVEVSEGGLAPKNDAAIFALAMALKLGDEATRRLAAAAAPRVCRIGTHIFQLAEAVQSFGGWGRVTARAFSSWYDAQPADALALNVIKYQRREGWSHKDLLAKAHPSSNDEAHAALYSWIARDGDLSARDVVRARGERVFSKGSYPERARDQLPRIIEGFEKVRTTSDAADVARLVRDYALPREALPTEVLDDARVWDALLHAGKGMPLTAFVRNLGKMSSIGLLATGSGAAKNVVMRLRDTDAIRRARVHPLSLLVALRVYAQGKGDKGSLTWRPVPSIVDALDEAFYLAFRAVEPTGKRHLLALDVSGSMSAGRVCGSPLTPREASTAMALVTANVEDHYDVLAFTSAGFMSTGRSMHAGYPAAISPVDITASMRLQDAVAMTSRMPFGGTDCALPMLYATANKLEVDAFVIYTDSETWAGATHPAQALRAYREKSGIDAKLVVVGMVSNGFSIADPNDAGMLDVVGFSTDTPAALASFVR
jgi:60 kDa SS-A/Ro ribonucleoprotein